MIEKERIEKLNQSESLLNKVEIYMILVGKYRRAGCIDDDEYRKHMSKIKGYIYDALGILKEVLE